MADEVRPWQTGDIVNKNGKVIYVGAYNRKTGRRYIRPIEWDSETRRITVQASQGRWLNKEELEEVLEGSTLIRPAVTIPFP